jgi:hypothetical protein
VPKDSDITWFGDADGSHRPSWQAPIGDWWAMVSAFKEGRPIVSDRELPPLNCSIAVLGDQARVSLSPSLRRDLLVTANLVDDVMAVLGQWPVRMPVTIIDSSDVTAGLIEALRRNDWEVTSEPAGPTQADVEWHVRTADDDEDDEDDEDDDEPDLVVGLRVEHNAAGHHTVRDYGTDAAGLGSYLAELPNLQRVRVKLEPTHPALEEATRLMTGAQLPWRRDRTEDSAELAGAKVTCADIGLQLVIDGYGWMSLRFDLDDHPVVGQLSYLRDSWTDLVAAVAHAAFGRGPAYCALVEEPDCKHVIVSSDGDWGRLEIRQVNGELFGDAQHPHAGYLVGAWGGQFADLATVVAGASRSLIDTAGLDGIEDRWTKSPPLAELDRLEDWLAHSRQR